MIDPTLHLNLITTGILLGLVYSLIAMGIAIIFKTTKVVNFSQGMLATFGAYVTLIGLDSLGLPSWASVLLSLAVGVVLAVALERVVLRQFIGEPILSVVSPARNCRGRCSGGNRSGLPVGDAAGSSSQ
jgi:branched-chain amino acid transport system permease protein